MREGASGAALDCNDGSRPHRRPGRVTLATVLMVFLCSVGIVVEVSTTLAGTSNDMTTSSLGRPGPKRSVAVSEAAVARFIAAVHGALVCFVLAVVVAHRAGLHLDLIGQVALVGAFLTGAGALALRSWAAGGRG